MEKDKILGVALAKEACPLCGSLHDGPILMNTRLNTSQAKKIEDLHQKVIGYMDKPCDSCQELMSKGFLLIGIVSEKSEDNNPYRSGNQWVITLDYAERLLGVDNVGKGAAFIDIIEAEKLGFPVENVQPKTEP